MPIRQGRCTNFDQCDIARSGQLVPVPEGANFLCPQCARGLTEVQTGPTPASGGVTSQQVMLIVLFCLLVMGSGFAAWKFFNSPRKPSGTLSSSDSGTILRLAGSNTIGASLGPRLAAAFLTAQGATDVRILAGDNAEEKSVQGTLPGQSSPAVITIAAHGSGKAFPALREDKADIGMSSRSITKQEAVTLSGLGNMFAGTNEHVLGLDGIAVIVNASNPVRSLSKDQILHLFIDPDATWSRVGGTSGRVKVYARDDSSGTYDTFKALVLGSSPLAPGAQRFEDSAALSDAVAADPNGIGFIGLAYIHHAQALSVADQGATPLPPNRTTVGKENYLLTRRLYLYTPANPASPFTRRFVEFALSIPGQDLVDQEGFVGQNAERVKPEVSTNASTDYKHLAANNDGLRYSFRFRSGSADLDNAAMDNIQRAIAYLRENHVGGHELMLLGFADSSGNASANRALSRTRAEAVRKQFAINQLNLPDDIVRGFGSEMPVASNDTEEGREKNRRVEIWIKR